MIAPAAIILPLSGFVAGAACALLLLYIRSCRSSSRILKRENETIFVYSGNLKQTPLLEALQLLDIGKREGILHIYTGRRKGYISIAGGTIIDAFYRNYTGKEAVFKLLDLGEGDFYFEQKPIKQPHLQCDSLTDIIFEWDVYRQ